MYLWTIPLLYPENPEYLEKYPENLENLQYQSRKPGGFLGTLGFQELARGTVQSCIKSTRLQILEETCQWQDLMDLLKFTIRNVHVSRK